jgi:G3E family GTPase
VTLLTGFLGAGKSTLLARLLSDPGRAGIEGPVRAVVNDVGDLPLDPTLVAEADGVQIELSNGCGCCQATGDLTEALDRAGRGAALVVLEASGVADPLALAQVVEARSGLRLDRIVTAVDPVALPGLLLDHFAGPIVGRQLDAASAVVVTNVDRLTADARPRVVAEVAAAAPGRPIGLSSRARPLVGPLVPGAPTGAAPIGARPRGHRDPVVATVDQRAELTRARLDRLLEVTGPGLLRGKGRLRVGGDHVWLQLTPSSRALSPADPGPCQLTVVATSGEAVATLVEELESEPRP